MDDDLALLRAAVRAVRMVCTVDSAGRYWMQPGSDAALGYMFRLVLPPEPFRSSLGE